jgi:hypothetical protein
LLLLLLLFAVVVAGTAFSFLFFRETHNNYCRINGMLLSRAAAERERVESGELSEDC